MPLGYSDVGGSDGARWQTMTVHGSRDDQMPLLINGMPFNNMNNSGGGYNHTLAINTGTVQEMTVTTSGSTSEVKTSGVVANTVAKEGGNRFSYYFYGDFSNGGLQSDNLDDELRAKGLQSVDHVKSLDRDQSHDRRPDSQGSAVVLRRVPLSALDEVSGQLVRLQESRSASGLLQQSGRVSVRLSDARDTDRHRDTRA